jgi:hypothetical protein
MTPYHSFFLKLKQLYITDYISISEKIVYLLLENLTEYRGAQAEEESIAVVENVLKYKYVLRNKKKKKKYNKKVRNFFSRYSANQEKILNYKKKF